MSDRKEFSLDDFCTCCTTDFIFEDDHKILLKFGKDV